MDLGMKPQKKIELLETLVGVHKIKNRQRGLGCKQLSKAHENKIAKNENFLVQEDTLQNTKQTNKLSNKSVSTLSDNSCESNTSSNKLMLLDDTIKTSSNAGFGYKSLNINSKFAAKSKFFTEHVLVNGRPELAGSISPKMNRIRFKRTDMLFADVPQLLENKMIINMSDSLSKNGVEDSTHLKIIDWMQEFKIILQNKGALNSKRPKSSVYLPDQTIKSSAGNRSVTSPHRPNPNANSSSKEIYHQLRSLSGKLMRIKHGHCITYNKIVAYLHQERRQLDNQESYKYIENSSYSMSFRKLEKSDKKLSQIQRISLNSSLMQSKVGSKKGKNQCCLFSCF